MTHIRQPNPRNFRTTSSGFVRRGASNAATAATLCGAPVTAYDVTFAERRWFLQNGDCDACKAKAS
jgi:hypothetical protein